MQAHESEQFFNFIVPSSYVYACAHSHDMMYGYMRWMNGHMGTKMDERTDGYIDGYIDEHMDGEMDG